MTTVSSMSRQKSWHTGRERVSVLAEMALRREKVVQKLIELRERTGLSQEDAAHKVGVTVRQWQRWEAGESMPYPRNLDLIASRFGFTVAEFFDDETPAVVDIPTPLQAQLAEINRKLDRLLKIVDRPELEALLNDPATDQALADLRARTAPPQPARRASRRSA